MKQIILVTTSIIFISLHPLWGQDSIFYNSYNKVVKSMNNCATYDVLTKLSKKGKTVKVQKYSINRYLISEIDYSDFDKQKKNGVYKTFWPNGQVKYSANYKKNILVGKVESFANSGYRKREELYTQGVMTQGICFDSTGNQIKYFPYQQLARFTECNDVKNEEAAQLCFDENYSKFLDNNLEYPAEAKTQNIQGRVVAGFTVQTDGTISDIVIISDIGGGCGAEVERILGLFPTLIPAKEDGIPVKIRYKLPINFTLR
jgi:hypothetical protein